MAECVKINKSRKRKLLLDNDIYELDPEDRSPVESPTAMTVKTAEEKEEEEEEEISELDASQESGTFDNLSESVSFDKTVGPGAAPDGYILIDEDLAVDDADNSINRDNNTPESSRPIFKVMFRDIDAAREHRKSIKEFLQNLIAKNTKVKAETDSSGLILEIWDQHVDPEDGEISGSTEPENSQESLEDQLFMIDTKPKLKDDLDIPTYGKKFEKVLEKQAKDGEAANMPEDCAPKLSCFNCLGNHNLRDCTEPRNHANINKNRKEFTAKMGPRNGRYHLEDEQKFGHFVPGQLSENLRRALGLRNNALPKHIYSMRILGYPPGWMEEARVQHSGLTLFNSDGHVDLDPADEEGEIILSGEKDEFDVKKIIDFPGFNVTPPPGTRDESKYYNTPRMQEMHSKELMLSTLSGRKAQDGYKRRKMKVTRSGTVTNDTVFPSEMEVVDVEDSVVETLAVNGLFIPPLPKETPPKPPEPPVVTEDSNSQSEGPESLDSTNQTTRAKSPTLSDLEVAKKQLLAELHQPGIPLNPGTPINHGKSGNDLDTSENIEMPPPMKIESTPQSSRTQKSRQDTPKTNNTGGVKSVDLGTPILQSTSPYSKLPSSDKFSKNICDHMNFENLPDSTGKYEKMSEIILKVRDVVSRIQQELS